MPPKDRTPAARGPGRSHAAAATAPRTPPKGAPPAPSGRNPAAPGGTLDITPDKSLIRKLGSTSYRTYEALSELIDNSIDARMSGPIRVGVALDYAGKTVTVSDDGMGMGLPELRDAMTIAKETSYPPGKRLGLFGMGMKAACSFLGRSFTISTSRPGSGTEYVVEYDEDRWERAASAQWQRFPYKRRAKPDKSAHGTTIEISKIKVPLYAEQTTRFKKRFGERYAAHLRQKQARITINSVACAPESLQLAENSEKHFKVKTPAGSMPAWVGLLRRRSVVGSYGINLYYRDRLVKAHTRFGIGDHPQIARVVGGISLDHVPVNFYKTDFITESAEYKEAEDAFRAHPALRDVASKSARAPLQPVDAAAVYGYLVGDADDPPRISVRPGRDESRRLLDALAPFEFPVGGRNVAVRYGDAGGELYAMSLRGRRLEVTINKNSPVFDAAKNPLYMVALAVADARMAAAGGGRVEGLLEERNRNFASLVGGWTRPSGGRPVAASPDPQEYRLSRSLNELRAYLDIFYPFKFTFTGLSTLDAYTHNALATPFYSLYTEKEQGRHLAETVVQCGDRYAPLISPVGDDLDMFFDATRSKSVIVIREYAESQVARKLALPAQAWADLFREVSRYRMPLMPEDLQATLEELRYRRLLDRRDLEAILRRRGGSNGALGMLEQVFAAQ